MPAQDMDHTAEGAQQSADLLADKDEFTPPDPKQTVGKGRGAVLLDDVMTVGVNAHLSKNIILSNAAIELPFKIDGETQFLRFWRNRDLGRAARFAGKLSATTPLSTSLPQSTISTCFPACLACRLRATRPQRNGVRQPWTT